MRKIVLLLFFVLLVVILPFSARAESDVALENLTIQLWPDHDQPAVLVIYDFTLEANTRLPVIVRFQMPSNANLVAVARNLDGGLVTVDYEQPIAQGGISVVAFTVSEQTTYHLEYYLPYTLMGKMRKFVFTWPGDYAVNSFSVALQKPSAASNIVTEPVLTDITPDKNGFAYQAISARNLAAQETFALAVRYQNESDTLTASGLSVQPSSPLTENVPGQVSLMTYLPWALAGLAVTLIVGGIGWYWLSSRGSAGPARPQRRRVIRQKPVDVKAADKQIYCHECGKRARADDRFCRTCGTQLRQG